MATDLNLQVKINNQLSISLSSPVRARGGVTVLSWDFDEASIVDVDETDGTFELVSAATQLLVEIKIADNNVNLGTSSFEGNMSYIEMSSWTARNWTYAGVPLERGETYYGQLSLIDSLSRTSEIASFSFLVNRVPIVSNVAISPISPTINDAITLTYDYLDPDGGTEGDSLIRWFKNGVYQRNLDGQLVVKSSYMEIDDTWNADVLPHDGFEYGMRSSSNSSQVVRTASSIVAAEILPSNPNENDILKAHYKVDELSANDSITIRWFVNNVIQTAFNDNQYMRYNSVPGQVVRYEVNTSSGTNLFVSDEVVITASDFSVYDIKVDGQVEPLEASTTTPNIMWKTHVPDGSEINYIHIEIGTFYEANNIYNQVFEINKDNFTVPANILERGIDYYISITVSDTVVFGEKTSSHFRIVGSSWSDSVDNNTGWTIETIYLIQDVRAYDPSEYQLFRITDGTFFAEVRLYNNKIGFVSEDFTYADIDSSGRNLLTIVGQGNDVKIYLDRQLVLDATGKFTQPTTDKLLELGNVIGSPFVFTYKYIYYTTSGAYNPGDDSAYSAMQFSTFLNLEDNEIVALKGYTETINGTITDTRVFASNPDDEDQSGRVYSIISSDKYKVGTVPITYSPISNIRSSPDGNRTAFAHAKGASIIDGYLINPFNFEIDFIDGTSPLPNENGWELVQNMLWSAVYNNDDGFNINTITRENN